MKNEELKAEIDRLVDLIITQLFDYHWTSWAMQESEPSGAEISALDFLVKLGLIDKSKYGHWYCCPENITGWISDQIGKEIANKV